MVMINLKPNGQPANNWITYEVGEMPSPLNDATQHSVQLAAGNVTGIKYKDQDDVEKTVDVVSTGIGDDAALKAALITALETITYGGAISVVSGLITFVSKDNFIGILQGSTETLFTKKASPKFVKTSTFAVSAGSYKLSSGAYTSADIAIVANNDATDIASIEAVTTVAPFTGFVTDVSVTNNAGTATIVITALAGYGFKFGGSNPATIGDVKAEY